MRVYQTRLLQGVQLRHRNTHLSLNVHSQKSIAILSRQSCRCLPTVQSQDLRNPRKQSLCPRHLMLRKLVYRQFLHSPSPTGLILHSLPYCGGLPLPYLKQYTRDFHQHLHHQQHPRFCRCLQRWLRLLALRR